MQIHFNPRSPHGERHRLASRENAHCVFQSTLPARGATSSDSYRRRAGGDFNPRSPHGERQNGGHRQNHGNLHFNPRSPHGERQKLKAMTRDEFAFQSTLPARGATLPLITLYIHFVYFNPRSPHGERQRRIRSTVDSRHFNPRSPHGERHVLRLDVLRLNGISIHAPRTGSDVSFRAPACGCDISIHAPRTGSDRSRAGHSPRRRDFNPRSPHGERLSRSARTCSFRYFNPRSPHGERPRRQSLSKGGENFNPRSPHGERLVYGDIMNKLLEDFNPRSPHGERPVQSKRTRHFASTFQSTLPARGATALERAEPATACNFNPRSPHGERQKRRKML